MGKQLFRWTYISELVTDSGVIIVNVLKLEVLKAM
jgi:hypothetical protein